VQGSSPNVGVVGINQVCSPTCNLVIGTAGQFITASGGLILQGLAGSTQVFSVDSNGNLTITGNLSKGSGSFKIDHPLDPANKYLSHSFVESPDMMNIYNGLVVLDSHGEAAVSLPDYFQALNSDFRYQLTAIGAPGRTFMSLRRSPATTSKSPEVTPERRCRGRSQVCARMSTPKRTASTWKRTSRQIRRAATCIPNFLGLPKKKLWGRSLDPHPRCR
jgi:hypothetical protein